MPTSTSRSTSGEGLSALVSDPCAAAPMRPCASKRAFAFVPIQAKVSAESPHPVTPVRRSQFLLFAGSRAKAPTVFSRASSAGKNKRPHVSTLSVTAEFLDQATVSATTRGPPTPSFCLTRPGQARL